MQTEKYNLRCEAKKILASISQERREEAKRALLEFVRGQCADKMHILSFDSFKSEIDTSLANQYLLGEGRLGGSVFDLILVPGLLFDQAGGRLGRGKGYYDRFLAEHPCVFTIGIGFKEQLYAGSLPMLEHDMRVNRVALF